MKAFHSDRQALPLPPGHPFPQSKYRRLRELVAGWRDLDAAEAAPASDAQLMLVHIAGYVNAVTGNRLTAAALRERRIPVALSMAGGYGKGIEVTVAIQLATLRTAIDSWRQWNNAGR